MVKYLDKLQANLIRFPKSWDPFLRNLFYMAASLKDEKEIRMNIYGGFEKYRECVKDEGLKGITLSFRWETDKYGYKVAAYRAVIKPKVLLAQLEKYCAA